MPTFNGDANDNTINGGTGNDIINGLGGNDTLYGHGGNDRLDGGTGTDTMYGGIGNDIYTVDNVGDSVNEYSGEGTDTVRTTLTSYTLGAYVEKLTFIGSGSFTGTGNSENNEIVGGGSSDTIYGHDGYDVLWGSGGNDYLYGGADGDLLSGDSGADYMEGNDGDDVYIIDNVNDVVVEQANEGIDGVYVGLSSYTLLSEFEDLNYNLWTGNFVGTGNELDNRIYGGSGNDTLSGLDGNDQLTGSYGDDTLDGGDGNDVLIGERGADILTGGASADTFQIGSHLDSGLGSAADTITDFESGIDLIDLAAMDADTTNPGDDSFTFIDDAPFTNTPGQLRAEIVGSQTVIQGDINGDGTADFEIYVDGAPLLASSDFVL